MNVKLNDQHSSTERLLTVFNDNLDVESLVFYRSQSGVFETRALDKLGCALKTNSQRLLGEALWREMLSLSFEGFPVEVDREHAARQAFALFGPLDVSRFERSQLDISSSCSSFDREQHKHSLWL